MDAQDLEESPVKDGVPTPLAGRVVLWLAGIATIIVVMSGVLYLTVVVAGRGSWLPLWEFFDVARENNVATWYGSVLWVLLAVCATFVGVHAPSHRLSWFLIAAVAAYASVDEYAMLHEKLWVLGERIAGLLPFDPFSYRWVIAGLVIVVVVALMLVPLAVRLPRRVLAGLLAAGAVFLLGAVGLETAGGFVERHFGQVTWHLMLLIHLEEWLEKVGVALAAGAVLAMVRVTRSTDGFTTTFGGYRPRRGERSGSTGQSVAGAAAR